MKDEDIYYDSFDTVKLEYVIEYYSPVALDILMDNIQDAIEASDGCTQQGFLLTEMEETDE